MTMTLLDLPECRRHNQAAIRAASSSQIAASLVALCQKLDAPDAFVDFDQLMSLGVFLDSAGHEQSDAVVVPWLREHPTFRRLDIVAALLNGLWGPAGRKQPVDIALVRSLVQAREAAEALDPGSRSAPDARYGYATALQRVLEDVRSSSEAVELAAGPLTALVETGTGDTTLDAQLASVAPRRIEAARARFGLPPAPGGGYRGLSCEEGAERYFVVERTSDRSEIIRARLGPVAGSTLPVEYEVLDRSMAEGDARKLVFEHILVALCRDSYRPQVQRIRYVSAASRRTVETAYEPPS